MKNNHFWSPKKRKISLPEKVLKALKVKKRLKIITSGQQK